MAEVQRYPRVRHDLSMADFRTRDEFLAWFQSLPALERAKLGRMLADVSTTKAIRESTDAAVYELTRDRSWAEVADLLDVGTASINKAIQRYNGRPRPRVWPKGDEGSAD